VLKVHLYWDAEEREGKSVCVVGGSVMVLMGMVMMFSGVPWLGSVPNGTGTANAVRGARREINNLKSNIFIKGMGDDMKVVQQIREDRLLGVLEGE
jgi:hypothetical protein